jgi:hypothetical protein
MPYLAQENDILLDELHKTQELLEHKGKELKVAQERLVSVQSRLQRVLSDHPNYWEMGQILVLPHAQAITRDGSDWLISDVVVDSCFVSSLYYTVDLTTPTPSVIIHRFRNGEPANTWVDWKSIPHHIKTISVGEKPSPLLSRLSRFGKLLTTTEWRIASSIPALTLNILTDRLALMRELSVNVEYHRAGIRKLDAAMATWPLILRYDNCELVNTSETPSYSSITLKLYNASINRKIIDELIYTFSTSDARGTPFGSHPRLEFNESCIQVFEKWFPETIDSRGARMEVRFAHPGDMDIAVWDRMVDSDKLIVVALIADLSEQIKGVESNNSHFNNKRDRWCEIATSVKNITRKNLL